MTNRRSFITLLSGTAAWPVAARGQQRAMPVIGYLSGRTADFDVSMLDALRRGLADVGYAEGRNVAVEYRFADGDAAARLGQKLLVLEASTAEEIDAQFARLDQEPADAMLVTVSPFFVTRAGQIVALAARHRIAAIYYRREFAEAGGLMSYGDDIAYGYREAGRYAGRILNGEKPADLPIIQPTKFELVINLKAAKAINFEFPPLVRALADVVIE
jgi:ABC-type uncharacterized transport system substrate-binding protein